MSDSGRIVRYLTVSIIVVSGLSAGIGLYTFTYAEGTSYFSENPEACVNCHIMQPQYDSWLKSSHSSVATCVDCHLPHEPVRKYLSKAANGWSHSRAFTFQDFPEPITITEKNSRILQENCINCHSELTHAQTSVNQLPHIDGSTADKFTCVHCHVDVGHGERAGMGVLEEHSGREGFEALLEEIRTETNE